MPCLCRQVNSFRLLLDCGWDDAYDPALLAPLLPQLPELDGVLISHPDPAHLGALPYLARSSLFASSAECHCSGQLLVAVPSGVLSTEVGGAARVTYMRSNTQLCQLTAVRGVACGLRVPVAQGCWPKAQCPTLAMTCMTKQ